MLKTFLVPTLAAILIVGATAAQAQADKGDTEHLRLQAENHQMDRYRGERWDREENHDRDRDRDRDWERRDGDRDRDHDRDHYRDRDRDHDHDRDDDDHRRDGRRD